MQVLIIGGGGIAIALAEHYLNQGYQVSLFSRSACVDSLLQAQQQGALCWYQSTEADENQYQLELTKIFSQPVYAIFCCIGFLHAESHKPEKTMKSLTAEFLIQNLQANTVAPALWLQRLQPYLSKQSQVKMLWLSAKVGSISDNQLGGWYSYRASKAALNMLVKTTAIEFRRLYPELVLVTVHPGTTDTELSKPFQQNVPAGQLQTAAATAARLAKVAEHLSKEQHGLLLNWDGQVLPF